MVQLFFSKLSDQGRRQQQQKGFTLVELLAALGMIIVLTSVALIGTRGISQPSSVKGAVSAASTLALSARSEAMALGYGARLVIDFEYDEDRPQTYLRRMTILRGVDVGGDRQWQLTDKPTLLPEGTYFYEDYSSGYDEMFFDFSDLQPQDGTSGDRVVYYEFDENGRYEPNSLELAKMVFVNALPPTSETLIIPDSMANSRDGFIIRNAGRLTFYERPDQITANPNAP